MIYRIRYKRDGVLEKVSESCDSLKEYKQNNYNECDYFDFDNNVYENIILSRGYYSREIIGFGNI